MPLFQSESKCKTILKNMTLHENETKCKTHFHMKGFALRESSYNMTSGGGMKILKLEA